MEIRTLTRNHKFYKLHLAAQSLPAPIRTVDARTRQTPTFVVEKGRLYANMRPGDVSSYQETHPSQSGWNLPKDDRLKKYDSDEL